MVDIFPQAVSWPSPSQYIQSIINSNPNGTTYVLKAGVHRMQTVSLYQNDTFQCEPGAILRGSEDVQGWSWTNEGNGIYSAAITSLGGDVGGQVSSGYESWRNHLIVDGEPLAWVTTLGAVDQYRAYWSGSRMYMQYNPASVSSVELSRQSLALEASSFSATGVTVIGDRSIPLVIENYCPGVQSENAGVRVGRSGTSGNQAFVSNWVLENAVVRNLRGMSLAHGKKATVRRVDVYNSGQLGVGGSFGHNSIVEYCAFYRNGIGGWNQGWEGGTSKFAHIWDDGLGGPGHILRGSYFDNVSPHSEGQGSGQNPNEHPIEDGPNPLWYDIDNDGAHIVGNMILDRTDRSWRGIFWEISFSVKFEKNIVAWVCDSAPNTFWSGAFLFSCSAAEPPDSYYSESEVMDNWFHQTQGGVGQTFQARGTGDDPPWTAYTHTCKNVNVTGNLFGYRVNSFGRTGDSSDNVEPPNYMSNVSFGNNSYFATGGTAGNHFKSNEFGNPNTWSQWRAAGGNGWDADSQMTSLSTDNLRNDPNPFRGGCL